MKRFFSLLIVSLLLLPSLAKAQTIGAYTERGLGVSAGFSSADDVTGLSVGMGYAFSPMFEAGISVGRSTDDVAELTATGVGPFVGIYPIRQTEDLPISIRLGAGYTFQSFSGDAVDALEDLGREIGVDVDVTGNALGANGALFFTYQATPKLQLIPIGEVGYVRQEITIDVDGEDESEDDSITYVSFGGSLVMQPSGTSKLALTPSVTLSEGDTSFSISAMWVLPQ